MIFGIGFALCVLCPIAYGTFEPEWGSIGERIFVWGFLLGLLLCFVSTVLHLAAVMP